MQLTSTGMPSSTFTTCNRVSRWISSDNWLLWSGDRCCTSTNAIPGGGSAGMAEKSASKAASPPAEAPIPTMGNAHSGCGSRATAGDGISAGSACAGGFVSWGFVVPVIGLPWHRNGAVCLDGTPAFRAGLFNCGRSNKQMTESTLLPDLIAHATRLAPQAIALIRGATTLSYAELDLRTHQLASGLVGLWR